MTDSPDLWLTLDLDPGVADFLGLPVKLHVPAEAGAAPSPSGTGFTVRTLADSLGKAVALHPGMAGSAEIHRFLARAPRLADLENYLAVGNPTFARTVAQGLLRGDPGDPAALSALGGLELAGDDPDRARDLLEQALERAPSHAPTRLECAVARAAAGDPGTAIRELTELARHPQARVQARIWLFELRRDRWRDAGRRWSEAAPRFRRLAEPAGEAPAEALRELFPDNPEVEFLLALHPRGAADDAERAARLEAVLAAHPDHPDARGMLTTLYRRAGRHGDALRCVEEGLAHRPGDPSLRAVLGTCHEQLGRSDEARHSYRSVFETPLAQVPPPALRMASHGLVRVGDPEETRVLLEDARTARPGDPVPYMALAEVDERADGPLAAERRLRTGLRECGPHPELEYALGDVLRRQDRPLEAEGLFRSLLKRHPDSAWGHRGLGDLVAADDVPAALEHYARALGLDPWTPIPGHDALQGTASLREGRTEEAVQWLERSLAGEPGNARTWCTLGAAYFHAGRLEDAIRATERAVSLDPDDAGYYHNLAAYHETRFRRHPLTALGSWWTARRMRREHAARRGTEDRNLWTGPGSTEEPRSGGPAGPPPETPAE